MSYNHLWDNAKGVCKRCSALSTDSPGPCVSGADFYAGLYADRCGDVLRLRAALDQCMAQFAFYAAEHAKAGKAEKAATNQRFADLCHAALADRG